MVVIKNRGVRVSMSKVLFIGYAYHSGIESKINDRAKDIFASTGKRLSMSARDDLRWKIITKLVEKKKKTELESLIPRVCTYLTETGGYILPVKAIDIHSL